jgi:hypothetical protein
VQGAGDALLTDLLSGWTTRSEQAASVAFAGRCLEAIVPSPKVRREIAASAVDFAVECGAQGWSGPEAEKPKRTRPPAIVVLSPLFSASVENRGTVAEVVRDRLLSKVSGSREESLAALEIALRPGAFYPRPHRPSNQDAVQYWYEVFRSVINASQARLRELAYTDLSLCISGMLRDLLPIEDLLDWHGVASLFRSRTYRCFTTVGIPYSVFLIRNLISYAIGDWPLESIAGLEDEVGRLGRWLLDREPPWMKPPENAANDRYGWESAVAHIEAEELRPNDLSPDTLFGSFCLFALNSELFSPRRPGVSDRVASVLKRSNLMLVVRLASARSMPLTPAKMERLLSRCAFDGTQSRFIARWIEGDINLTSAGNIVQMELLPDAQVDLEDLTREDFGPGLHG